MDTVVWQYDHNPKQVELVMAWSAGATHTNIFCRKKTRDDKDKITDLSVRADSVRWIGKKIENRYREGRECQAEM